MVTFIFINLEIHSLLSKLHRFMKFLFAENQKIFLRFIQRGIVARNWCILFQAWKSKSIKKEDGHWPRIFRVRVPPILLDWRGFTDNGFIKVRCDKKLKRSIRNDSFSVSVFLPYWVVPRINITRWNSVSFSSFSI